MPLVTDPAQTREILDEARERGAALGAFCTENEQTTEAILIAAQAKAQALGRADLPVMVSCTVSYPPRAQMRLFTASGDERLGLRAFFAHLEAMVSDASPYRALRVLPVLDHAFPWLDGYALREYVDRFAIVMFDASEKVFGENIRLTATYCEQVKGRVLVEGCVDEIKESGSGTAESELTTVENAKRYLAETGVDLIVANLGTEHRATLADRKYSSTRARAISATLGKILVLHGTSCLTHEELPRLAGDGVIKVNIYTVLARVGGQAVARRVLQNLGNIFSEAELRELQAHGYLGGLHFTEGYRDAVCGGALGPKLDEVAEAPRRDAWVGVVKTEVLRYMDALGYNQF